MFKQALACLGGCWHSMLDLGIWQSERTEPVLIESHKYTFKVNEQLGRDWFQTHLVKKSLPNQGVKFSENQRTTSRSSLSNLACKKLT